jgi:catechol 2,3-dioxygenase-like lactoylglutathione lyase family enzyme
VVIAGIDVVFIHSTAKDLVDWYTGILGLKIVYSDQTWTEYLTEGTTRFAIEHVSYPKSVVENQAMMISFRVANIYQAVEILAALGVRFFPSCETAIFEAGSSLVATFQDPAGNWVQLSQRKESHS